MILIAIAGACSGDNVVGTRHSPDVLSVGGDQQHGSPGKLLAEPLIAGAFDANGAPVVGVLIHWTATDGEITPPESRTDDEGLARATWVLGATAGEQLATATIAGGPSTQFRATVDGIGNPGKIALRALQIVTFDGSGQAVHPDALEIPAGSPAAAALASRWLTATPYPYGDANRENPSVYLGNDGVNWKIPAGAANPIVTPSTGYLSDPDIIFASETNDLWVYYRQVNSDNRIMLIRSSDGVHWSAPRLVVQAPSHEIVSPTVVRRAADDWLMWSVNSGAIGCTASATRVELRRSRDGLAWSAPQTVALTQPGRWAWHIDVEWIAARNEYWAVFNGKTADSCTTEQLFIATSADGLTWKTFPSPILQRGAIPEFADVVYRASFSHDAASDLVTFWHSGARYDGRGYAWHLGYERRTRAELFAAASRTTAAAIVAGPRIGPPLNNRSAP